MTHQFCSAVENNASIPSFWQYSSTKLYYSNSRVNLPLYSLLNQEDLYDYSLMLPVRLAQYLEQIKRFFFFFWSACLNWILYGAGKEAEIITTQNFTSIISYSSILSRQYSCLENPHGQRSLAGYSQWGTKSWT